MHVVTVCQNKGGDGKTTISRLLGEWASRLGLRTLMIDMDPQCNLSQRFLKMDADAADPDGVMPPVHPEFDNESDWDGRSSIVDIYTDRITRFGLFPYPTANANIDILPGCGSQMRAVELVRRDELKDKIVDRLHLVLSGEEMQSLYDLVVVDTPPSKGPLVQSAVRAATHMLIPCQMEQQSVEGLQGMLQQWRRENRVRTTDRQLELIGILPNKFRGVALQVGVLEGLRNRPAISDFLIPVVLAQRTVFAETDHPEAKPKSVFDLPASDKAKQEATNACKYIFEKLGIKTTPERQKRSA